MKVLFLGKAIDEASTRYRVVPVMAHLTRLNHQAEFMSSEASVLQKLQLLLNVGKYDVIVLQRKLFSTLFLKLLRRRAEKIVFDFDDAIFVKSSGHSSKSRMEKFVATCEASDEVLAGNAYLADAAREAGAKAVTIVPTSIEFARYQHEAKGAQKSEPITLVWIGSSSTRRYLDMLTPVLDWLAAEHNNIQLKVISDFDFHLETLPVTNIRWSAEAEVRELASSHIGIAPMMNDAWTKGKCALKVLQYMAVGLPVVSARAGANAEVIEEDGSGFLVETEEQWFHSVTQLIQDESLRIRFGERGREIIAEGYDLDVTASTAAQKILELGTT